MVNIFDISGLDWIKSIVMSVLARRLTFIFHLFVLVRRSIFVTAVNYEELFSADIFDMSFKFLWSLSDNEHKFVEVICNQNMWFSIIDKRSCDICGISLSFLLLVHCSLIIWLLRDLCWLNKSLQSVQIEISRIKC